MYQLIAAGILTAIAGAARGLADLVQFHYYKLPERYQEQKKQQYFNPNISWTNKYKNNNPQGGPKFLLSTTFLKPLTDFWSLMQMIYKHAPLIAAALLFQGNVWTTGIIYIGLACCFGIGFKLTYK